MVVAFVIDLRDSSCALCSAGGAQEWCDCTLALATSDFEGRARLVLVLFEGLQGISTPSK
eukprot:15451121-Alexandrium_andersonii.AAC.1